MKTMYLSDMNTPTAGAGLEKRSGRVFRRYLFPPLYGLVVYFTIRLLLDTVTGMKFWERPLYLTIDDLIACLAFSYLFLFAFDRLLRWLDRTRPSDDFSNKRILRELMYVFLLNVVFQNAILHRG